MSMEKCAIYSRVSTEIQKDNFSTQLQESRGKEFCQSNNYEPVLYEDIQSGSSLNRYSFNKLIADIEDGKINAVWVIEFSRLSRNDEEDAIFIKRLFIENSIKLFDNGREVKFNTPEDQLFFNIRSSVSAYERRKIVERMTNGLREKIDKGGRRLPRLFGYRDAGVNKVLVDKDAKQVINFIFQQIGDGKTFGQIQKDLILRGYKRFSGDVKWSSSSISKIAHQTAYIGKVYNTKKELIDSTIYPRIISDELWNKVRNRLDIKRRYKHNQLRRVGQFELSGILECQNCGTKYFRKSNIKVKNGVVKEKGFFTHSTRTKKSLECKNKLQRKTVDEVSVLRIVRALYIENFSSYEDVIGFYDEEVKKVDILNKDFDIKINELQKQLVIIDKEKKKLIDLALNNIFTNEELKNKKQEIDKREDDINKELNKLYLIKVDKTNIIKMLEDYSSEEELEFIGMNQQQRKELYMRRIKKLTIIENRLECEFINNKKFVIDDIMNLDDEWESKAQLFETHLMVDDDDIISINRD